MLRFLQETARSAVDYFHHHGIRGQHSSRRALTYTDKYSSKIPRGFTNRPLYGQDVWETIHATQQKAHRAIDEEQPLENLKAILQGCPHVPEIINVRDMLGYNLLQYAIISHHTETVRYLFHQGADLNLPVCARPLHLAAKLGFTDIVEVLLECGADPDVMSCVCYPESHILQRTMFVSESECWSVACFGDIYTQDKLYKVQFEYPLYYAIMSDSIDCVHHLVSHKATIMSTRSPKLHTACQYGSFECVKYFMESEARELTSPDHKGLYPLQYAVQWGKQFAEYLVLKGATVTVKTSSRESLVILFLNQSKSVSNLVETVRYLLDCGLRMMVNVVDSGGNSPLHALFRKLHRNPPKWPAKAERVDTNSDCLVLRDRFKTHSESVCSNSQFFSADVPLSTQEKEYLACTVLLLQAGANTNIANKVGNTCLHDLLRIQRINDLTKTPEFCSLRLIYMLLVVLFKHGTNPRFVNNMHVTAHGSLIANAADILFQSSPLAPADPIEVNYLIKCIYLLKSHGCSYGTDCAMTPLQHILNKLDALEQVTTQHLLPEERSLIISTYTSQVLQVTEALLDCGAKPTDLQNLYYQLMGQYPLVSTDIVKEAVLMFLHYGANPNEGGVHIPMSVFRSRMSQAHWPVYPLLHLLNLMASSDQTNTNNYLNDLFDVFYNAMDENGARQCLFHFMSYDSNQIRSFHAKDILECVRDIMTSPKTLRQITAHTVYWKLCRGHKLNVKKLGIPAPISRLLLSMQY